MLWTPEHKGNNSFLFTSSRDINVKFIKLSFIAKQQCKTFKLLVHLRDFDLIKRMRKDFSARCVYVVNGMSLMILWVNVWPFNNVSMCVSRICVCLSYVIIMGLYMCERFLCMLSNV